MNAQVSVDDEILNCLNLNNPQSFFLFAGAGSGKTRSLVSVLKKFHSEHSQALRLNGQKVAIITYTNAACDEIKRRLEFNALFTVSTIHSFAWRLIKPFQSDIREWLIINLSAEITGLEEKQISGRAGTKAAMDRVRQIDSKKRRLEQLDSSIRIFSYDPNGANSGRDSLNHAEVINITASFLTEKILMQKIVVQQYPVLLIDESQDTKKELMDAFFNMQKNHSMYFSLGLFGDTMQRIYNDGKTDLGINLPLEWAKPKKLINYRCPKRVITLINKIRSNVDAHRQDPFDENENGTVRLFIIDAKNNIVKSASEENIMCKMADITGDSEWLNFKDQVKILTLEHHMAATRGKFINFFGPLYSVSKLSTGLLDGTLPGVSIFIQLILPLVNAKRSGDEFKVAQIVRKYSPILSSNALKESQTPPDVIKIANSAVCGLFALWDEHKDPKIIEVIREVANSQLFLIPEVLAPILYRSDKESLIVEEDLEDKDEVIDAWDAALNSTFSELEAYAEYISDKSRYGTHQGVKGLEFPRVMVILDDDEARGFLFSYDKLFGAKDLSDTDRKNEKEGKETTIDRTRRLFYVTCSRAEKSLAIVAYTTNPSNVKNHVISQGWFNADEIEFNADEIEFVTS